MRVLVGAVGTKRCAFQGTEAELISSEAMIVLPGGGLQN